MVNKDSMWWLQQALDGIHSEHIKRLERRVNIGGVDYDATIYAVPPKVIRIDLVEAPKVNK